MKPETISAESARGLVIKSQLLSNATQAAKGKMAVMRTFDHLGYIQIDTIAVINRAHHHTIWTRCPGYNETQLNELQKNDRKIFEYWSHAMSYLPMSDFRYYLPKMHGFRSVENKWFLNHLDKCRHHLKPVLDRIRAEGPLCASDFENDVGAKTGPWWDWKPAKSALEILFWQGELMINERRNFQKYYELTERVLPADISTTMPAKDEITSFMVKRALNSGGLMQDKEINRFLQPASARDSEMQFTDLSSIRVELRNLQEEGEIVPVTVEGIDDTVYYANRKILKQTNKNHNSDDIVRLLSPFDNLVIQRDRLRKLFNFDYTIECYVPESKRRFGYFVLPVLLGSSLIGRLDPKADRATETLLINSLHFEPGFSEFDHALPKLADSIALFAKFNNCRKVKILKTSPGKYKSHLQRLVNNSI